jgi:hypothetical protein
MDKCEVDNVTDIILQPPVISPLIIQENMGVVKSKVKLTLNSLKVVATWKYSSENQECKLCNKNLMIPVLINHQDSKFTEPHEDVVIGICNHGFHAYCMNKWLEHKNISCPYCKNIWTENNQVGTSVYMYKSSSE